MEFIKGSTITYLVQTDLKGDIVDANNGFINSFNHIRPSNVTQIIAKEDLRKLVVMSERAKRMNAATGEIARVVFECRTVNKEKEYTYGLFEVAYIRENYYILGFDLFVSYEDGRGRIKRYENLLRDVAHALNHRIRSHSSNISGLLSIVDVKNREIAKQIFEQFEKLDKEILALNDKINRAKK